MPAPKKYPDELRERATRLAVEARRDPASAVGAIRRIADQLGIHPEALRGWVKKAEIDAGDRPGTTSSAGALRSRLKAAPTMTSTTIIDAQGFATAHEVLSTRSPSGESADSPDGLLVLRLSNS
ncbi:transposase [Micromonospora sp. NPDC000663]|uniref:transposase n=1 Tax=Micromonospora sp. NPDC000663 TaxID=3364218 RepID=UPI0036B12ABA